MGPSPGTAVGSGEAPPPAATQYGAPLLVPPPNPDKDTAQFYYQTVTTMYLTHVATAGLFFAPQVALLTGLLTSDGRVGGVGWVLFLLGTSDLLTVYFGWTAVVDSVTVDLATGFLERAGGYVAVGKAREMPAVARWADRNLARLSPRSSASVALLLAAIVVGALLTSGYTLWLWYHP